MGDIIFFPPAIPAGPEVVLPLQDELNAFKLEFEVKAPAEFVAVLDKATADLIASGLPDKALKAGARAPDFALPDSRGAIMRLADLLVRGPLVLTFHRGAWCPYCNLDLRALERAAGEVRALGASLVAISPQIETISRKSERDNALSFPILRDQGNVVAAAYGLRYQAPDDLLAVYKGWGDDMRFANGEGSGTLPLPARFVIGREGTIAYAEVNPDYTRRPDPSEWLPVLQRLRSVG